MAKGYNPGQLWVDASEGRYQKKKKATPKKPTTNWKWKNDNLPLTPRMKERQKKLGVKLPKGMGRRQAGYALYLGDKNLAKKIDAKKGKKGYARKKLKEMRVKVDW